VFQSDSLPLAVRPADLDQSDDRHALVSLLDAYARDPVGANQALAEDVKRRLIPALRQDANAVDASSLHSRFHVGR
jgi:hypothetical protein